VAVVNVEVTASLQLNSTRPDSKMGQNWTWVPFIKIISVSERLHSQTAPVKFPSTEQRANISHEKERDGLPQPQEVSLVIYSSNCLRRNDAFRSTNYLHSLNATRIGRSFPSTRPSPCRPWRSGRSGDTPSKTSPLITSCSSQTTTESLQNDQNTSNTPNRKKKSRGGAQNFPDFPWVKRKFSKITNSWEYILQRNLKFS